MRKRRRKIEIIGTSFLDVMSCGFIALFILYLKSPSVDGGINSMPENLEIVDVVVENGEPYLIGLSLKIKNKEILCIPPLLCKSNKKISWSFQAGQTMAIIQDEKPEEEIKVMLTSPPKDKNLPSEICVRIKTATKAISIKLEREKLYRAKINTLTKNSCAT